MYSEAIYHGEEPKGLYGNGIYDFSLRGDVRRIDLLFYLRNEKGILPQMG